MTISLSGKRFISSDGGGVSTYREKIEVVDDTAGAGELQGPLEIGTVITLPNSGDYQDVELRITENGEMLVPLLDYSYVGSGTRTQIQLERVVEGTREFPTVLEFFKVY